jgi:deoxyribonuclease-4
MIWFGPSGNTEKFYQEGFKSSWQMPSWLAGMGLNAYEYQCNKGTNIKRETAEKIGGQARLAGIRISIHAPYYINLSSAEEEKRVNSISYILKTLQVAKWMGADRIVIHPGNVGKLARDKAMLLALPILAEAIRQADEAGFGSITLCPEVLGKISNLGSLDEVLTLCTLDDRMIPCVDFGHVHARSLGGLKSPEDYQVLFDSMEKALGRDRTRRLHIHFSRVEFSQAGERKHHTLQDTEYGPEFVHLARVLLERKIEPVVICESRDRMAEDALILKEIYEGEKIRQ